MDSEESRRKACLEWAERVGILPSFEDLQEGVDYEVID